jgi:hypothetical protein
MPKMQSISTAPFRQADRLRALIDGLRAEPDVHLPTLRKLDSKIDALAGARLTIGKGRAIDGRVVQAKALTTGLRPTQAARRICEALGVSASTSWRYLRRIRNV